MIGGNQSMLDEFESRIFRLERLLDRVRPTLRRPEPLVESAHLLRDIDAELDDRLSRPE